MGNVKEILFRYKGKKILFDEDSYSSYKKMLQLYYLKRKVDPFVINIALECSFQKIATLALEFAKNNPQKDPPELGSLFYNSVEYQFAGYPDKVLLELDLEEQTKRYSKEKAFSILEEGALDILRGIKRLSLKTKIAEEYFWSLMLIAICLMDIFKPVAKKSLWKKLLCIS